MRTSVARIAAPVGIADADGVATNEFEGDASARLRRSPSTLYFRGFVDREWVSLPLSVITSEVLVADLTLPWLSMSYPPAPDAAPDRPDFGRDIRAGRLAAHDDHAAGFTTVVSLMPGAPRPGRPASPCLPGL
jgi:hypothetical protein